MNLEFQGFSAELLRFLTDLRANNTREWFAENKTVYNNAYRLPGQQFTDALGLAVTQMVGIPHSAKMFRLHRDVRFSSDKTPYNTHLHISLTPQSDQPSPPAWFFGFEPGKLTLGVGCFGFDPATLDQFRARVAGTDGAALAKTLGKLTAGGARLSEPDLKRVPPPYPADHPRADLLRHKGLALWRDLPDALAIENASLVGDCIAGLKTLRPIFDWLQRSSTYL